MLSTIIATLPKLTQKELDVVRALVAKLSKKDEDEEAPPLYTALVLTLGSKIPYCKFQETKAYQIWKQNMPLVLAFVDETWPGLQTVERFAIFRCLLELLVDNLRQRSVPVTPGSITSNLNSIPIVFDSAFPGYRENGLAGWLVQSMVNR